MAELDAGLQFYMFRVALPCIVLYLFFRYVLGVRVKIIRRKVEAYMFNLLCGFIHKKFCEKEKKLLFAHLADLTDGSKHLKVLEIGVGSGMNFEFYPKGSKVTCVDPNPYHEQYVIKNANKAQNVTLEGFVKCFAEKMHEVEDDIFDAVVCTLTLCTVRNPAAVLKEVQRVLKPGGTFFYLEHVAGQRGSFIRWFQDKLQLVWPYFSGGCSINRETWVNFDQSDFEHVQYRHYSVNTWFAFFARPCLYGTATK